MFSDVVSVSYTHLGEKGQRDYYWGRYGNSLEWAQRDFDRRVDDYQYLYHAAVKNTELGPDGVYRYYSTQRPVDIGTYPKSPDNQMCIRDRRQSERWRDRHTGRHDPGGLERRGLFHDTTDL